MLRHGHLGPSLFGFLALCGYSPFSRVRSVRRVLPGITATASLSFFGVSRDGTYPVFGDVTGLRAKS